MNSGYTIIQWVYSWYTVSVWIYLNAVNCLCIHFNIWKQTWWFTNVLYVPQFISLSITVLHSVITSLDHMMIYSMTCDLQVLLHAYEVMNQKHISEHLIIKARRTLSEKLVF
jgi:hypothetical protein